MYVSQLNYYTSYAHECWAANYFKFEYTAAPGFMALFMADTTCTEYKYVRLYSWIAMGLGLLFPGSTPEMLHVLITKILQ